MKTLLSLLALLSTLMPGQSAFGANPAEEARWAAQLRQDGVDGTPVELETQNGKVFALFSEDRSGKAQGGVILLHDVGGHPDWPAVTGPLRRTLPDYGWSTLSIQLPLPPAGQQWPKYGPLVDEAPPRIQAAVDYLKGRNIHNIVLIGHGLGAIMAADYLSRGKENLNGLVLIGVGANGEPDPRLDAAALLEKLSLPILDLYGSRDLAGVTSGSERRLVAARKAVATASADPYLYSGVARTYTNRRAGPIAYRQVRIEGADHGFTGLEPVLIKRVRGWLRRHASGTRILISNP